MSACRFIVILTAAAVLFAAPLAAQYKPINYTPPAELGPGVKDSMLRDIIPAEPTYPAKGAKEAIRTAVWLRVTVGELGKVKNAEAIRCVNPGYGFEDKAIEAVKEALFFPQWNGVYPKEYVGYYPVVFVDPSRPVLPRNFADKIYNTIPGSLWRVSGSGFDAPEIEPLAPLIIQYPEKALRSLMEADASVKLRVNKKGKAVSTDVKEVSVPGYDFVGAAEEAARNGAYPIKLEETRPVDYVAYVTIKFRLSREQLIAAGAPDPDQPANVDTLPAPVAPRRIVYTHEAFEKKLEGTAAVAILIDSTARVITAHIDSSSGSVLLDRDALAEARGMQYFPAKRNGVSVMAWLKYPFVYKLRSDTVFNFTGQWTADSTDTPYFPLQQNTFADIEPPEILPKFTHFEKADYPENLILAGVEGTVKIAALIDEQGHILDTALAHSSRNRQLDSLAMAAVSKHTFTPGTTDGKRVKAWISWFVRFKPNSKEVKLPTPNTLIYPKKVHIEEPVYPEDARANGAVGTVTVRLYIDSLGNVTDAKLEHSSGQPSLDQAALAVTPKHKFTPAIYHGRPVSCWFNYEVEFSINKMMRSGGN